MIFHHHREKPYEFLLFLKTMIELPMNSYVFWGCNIFSSYGIANARSGRTSPASPTSRSFSRLLHSATPCLRLSSAVCGMARCGADRERKRDIEVNFADRNMKHYLSSNNPFLKTFLDIDKGGLLSMKVYPNRSVNLKDIFHVLWFLGSLVQLFLKLVISGDY